MYLVDVESLNLKYFPTIREASAAGYVTLSHRWAANPNDELTFQELQARPEQLKNKSGYLKLLKAAEVVRSDGECKWLWIDTCCINKESSAELQEGINSMWEIYRRCEWCLAFLSDVIIKSDRMATDGEPDTIPWTFDSSKWFTRGWTLQELLAPPTVHFFAAESPRTWTQFSSRGRLKRTIEAITGIPARRLVDRSLEQALKEPDWRQEHCVANKMSWAAGRTTGRPEDEAYCLLGIMNIQLTLLYGEGNNAFRRLQEEIIRRTSDTTLLAWQSPQGSAGECKNEPTFLAPSPRAFRHWRRAPIPIPTLYQEWTQTNLGLSWVAQPTGFAAPVPEEYLPVSLNVLLYKTSLNHCDVSTLLRNGLQLYWRPGPSAKEEKTLEAMTDQRISSQNLQLKGRSVFLTLNLVAFFKNPGTQAYWHHSISLIALSEGVRHTICSKLPKHVVVLGQRRPVSKPTKREYVTARREGVFERVRPRKTERVKDNPEKTMDFEAHEGHWFPDD